MSDIEYNPNRLQNGKFTFGNQNRPELNANDPFATAPVAPTPVTVSAYRGGPNLDGATAEEVARANADLNQVFNHRGDAQVSLRSIVTEEGLSGRTMLVDDGKPRYLLTQRTSDGFSDDRAFEVTESTYDLFDAPDERSISKMAQQEVEVHTHAFDAVARTAAPDEAKLRVLKQAMMQAKDQMRAALLEEARDHAAQAARARQEQVLLAA